MLFFFPGARCCSLAGSDGNLCIMCGLRASSSIHNVCREGVVTTHVSGTVLRCTACQEHALACSGFCRCWGRSKYSTQMEKRLVRFSYSDVLELVYTEFDSS